MTLFDGFPFMGLLLSIALFPLIAPNIWHRHYGKIAFFWGGITLSQLLYGYGFASLLHQLVEILFHHYIPFMALVSVLFVIGGGIQINMKGKASPLMNTLYLGTGAVLASFVGTTGASMILIRPFLTLNHFRARKTHAVIFFIFLVSNMGGLLTPLGDPPLFLGFLNGVPFFWPMVHLFVPFLLVLSLSLFIFWVVDHFYFYHDPKIPDPESIEGQARFRLKGKRNILLLGWVIITVIISGIFTGGPTFTLAGFSLEWIALLRDVVLLGLIYISLRITPPSIYEHNRFSWEPLEEVGKIFLAIFVTIAPVITLLHAGAEGPFGALVTLVNPGGEPHPLLYFWLTGALSSFLDNAPTYLVFFNLAGGKVGELTTTLAPVLAAISLGSVLMGAMTYIGNAPNFMVRSIASRAHIKMPGFFGYMLWSCSILLPLFVLLSCILF